MPSTELKRSLDDLAFWREIAPPGFSVCGFTCRATVLLFSPEGEPWSTDIRMLTAIKNAYSKKGPSMKYRVTVTRTVTVLEKTETEIEAPSKSAAIDLLLGEDLSTLKWIEEGRETQIGGYNVVSATP